ncbi:MAG: transcription termination/antitermination protein NusA [Anaerolineae bacterium]|nr:transcription termination/antitermination protein NusA [Anaerolineae bacterium]
MKSELVMAINQICSERNLPQDVIIEAIETSLVSAYKKNYGGGQNVKATIDVDSGEPMVYTERVVVEEVQDDRFEITLSEARKQDKKAALGSIIQVDITPEAFGRIAAQTAKQVILQRIREAERDALFSSYADREGELITGVVASITPYAIALNLGRTEATMPRNQQVSRERYRVGQRIRVYVVEVRRSSRGPQIVVSRTHSNMLRRMLELEVPEIFNGIVEIKSISREAGSRSKVAVAAQQEGVDPVGSCVGIRGMRIQSIVNELGGEKIDVVEWSPDPKGFIANSLSPARVSYVILDERSNPKTATVVVPDDQLSLAIGKEGQNARLAAKLTAWRIDIKSESVAQGESLRPQVPLTIATQEQQDILAMAEAILLGKKPGEAKVITPIEPLVEKEPVFEDEIETAELEIGEEELAESEEEIIEEPEIEEVGIEEPVVAAPVAELPAVEASVQAVETPVAREGEPGGRADGVHPSRRPDRKPKYVFVADEELESLEATKSKSKKRKSRRQIVRDDESGELIVRRRHKREDELEWDEYTKH